MNTRRVSGSTLVRQLEHQISDVALDALALKANPLFDAADRQATAIAVKTMKAALRLRGFQYWPADAEYDEDIFRAYVPARKVRKAIRLHPS